MAKPTADGPAPKPASKPAAGASSKGQLPDFRPLDVFSSLKIKLAVLVTAAVVAAALITWVGMANNLGPSRTLPLAVVSALVFTQVLAHGMTSPLREMTAAARAMRKGDYSQYVTATSRDEVGELARAFNGMAEDLGAADRRRRDMIANVSHELRTPVAALQAELENMVDGVTQPTPQTLELALAQTERLGRLVTDMLDLSRLEADVVELTCEQVPVAEFFADALDAVAFVASTSGKDLRLTSEISPSNLTIWADADRLTQVTTNLLTNAIRHSPEHGTVALRAYQRARRVVIEVGDEGPGIAPERRADVFERFHRAEAPGVDPRASAGTGLGLAIARWAVELHGGTIEVADIQPGCTMRVTLPAKGPARGTGKGSARA